MLETIHHGLPKHNYIAILQPIYKHGGLDCSCVAHGIGIPYNLVNPHTKEVIMATLISKRTIYTDWDAFEALTYILYGVCKNTLMENMKNKYTNMIEEQVELWTFKINK